MNERGMNARVIPFVIFSIAFLLAIASILSIPQIAWNLIPTYEVASIAFDLLVGLATVLVAYWVYADYEWNYAGDDVIRRRLGRLEEIVDGKQIARERPRENLNDFREDLNDFLNPLTIHSTTRKRPRNRKSQSCLVNPSIYSNLKEETEESEK